MSTLYYIDQTTTSKDMNGRLMNYVEFPDIPGIHAHIPAAFIAVQQRPDFHHIWDFGTNQWVEDTTSSLVTAKQNASADLSLWFDNASVAPIAYMNTSFNGGFDSVSKLMTLLQVNQLMNASTVNVFDSNNVPVTMTLVQLTELIQLINAGYQTALTQKQDLSSKIANATTVPQMPVLPDVSKFRPVVDTAQIMHDISTMIPASVPVVSAPLTQMIP